MAEIDCVEKKNLHHQLQWRISVSISTPHCAGGQTLLLCSELFSA